MTVLHVRTGKIESMGEFQEWFTVLEPVFSLLEPAIVMRLGGQRGAPHDFRGLVSGPIDLGESRIGELRMDWDDGCVQFVAEGEGFVWSSHSVSGTFPPSVGRGEALKPIEDLAASIEATFWRTSGDLSRFAPEGHPLAGGPPARVIRYHRGPHLMAWWFQRPAREET